MNIIKLQDNKGHWYWVPTELVEVFIRDRESLSGLDYTQDPRRFDYFIDTYEKYRTHGDPDQVPSIFEEELQKRKEEELVYNMQLIEKFMNTYEDVTGNKMSEEVFETFFNI